MTKITITFKDPDGVLNCINDDVLEQVQSVTSDIREIEQLVEMRTETITEKLSKWIEYGEYITIEFDLDEMTARVKEIG